eukprot:COSAG02_NODE_4196_length_5640_cov_5.220770_4_plen_76_part_00
MRTFPTVTPARIDSAKPASSSSSTVVLGAENGPRRAGARLCTESGSSRVEPTTALLGQAHDPIAFVAPAWKTKML